MAWKTLFITLLTVGVFAQAKFLPEQSQRYDSAVRAYCTRNGAEDKTEEAKVAFMTFVDCITGLFNMETITNEINEAKRDGNYNIVFKKYCAKAPELKTCLNTLMDGVEPCMDSVSRSKVDEEKNRTAVLIDYVCYNDGQRIISFFAVGGPACVQSKISDISQCATVLQASVPTPEALNNMNVTEKCNKLDELSSCIVTALGTCDSSSTRDMAESFFMFNRKTMNCPKKQ